VTDRVPRPRPIPGAPSASKGSSIDAIVILVVCASERGSGQPVDVPPAVTVTIMIRPPGGPLIVRFRGHQRGKLLRDGSLPDSSSMALP